MERTVGRRRGRDTREESNRRQSIVFSAAEKHPQRSERDPCATTFAGHRIFISFRNTDMRIVYGTE